MSDSPPWRETSKDIALECYRKVPRTLGNRHWIWFHSQQLLIEVSDSRTGYLLPVRDGSGLLPDWESSWDVAVVAAAAVSWKFNSKIHQFSYLQRNLELRTIPSDPSRQVSIGFSDAGQS